MATLDELCNLALAEIAAGPISSVTESSIEAREVSRFSATVLAEVSLWSDWSWAVTRAVLADAGNDRTAEWLHAYAVPADCARPLAIRAPQADPGVLPQAGAYPFPLIDALPLAFLHEGGLIYSNVAQATLVYVALLTDPAALPPLVQRAFVLELAARVALPIRKDTGLARELGQAAELARTRAIAEDYNQRARRPASYVSEAALARAGIGGGL